MLVGRLLRSGLLLCVLSISGFASADEEDDRRREKAAEKAGVSREAVSKAIDDGSAYLLKKYADGFNKRAWNSTLELVMLTLAHAGVKEDNPVFARGLKALEKTKLQYTYRVAALAMALKAINHWKYRKRIAHCAQWLVDTQLGGGDWGYPRQMTPQQAGPKPVTVKPPPEAEQIPDDPNVVIPEIKIRRRPNKQLDMTEDGDISNAQFAILGLKACHDARVLIPKTTWKRALNYMRKCQRKDGGWGYYIAGRRDMTSYASMTCAGVCSVAICRYGLGQKNPAKHASINKGVKWLAKHFEVDENHGIEQSHIVDPLRWRYYYLYSIERVGQTIEIDKLGDREWYPEGARYLLDEQKPDGRWTTGVPARQWRAAGDLVTADTCFAILFLTRSTPRLEQPVFTGGPGKPSDKR